RVVVFRRHKQDGVRLAYPTLELRDLGWRVLFLVLVKDRDAVQLESFENRAFRHKFSCSPQRRAIVRSAPEAAGNSENTNLLFHNMYKCLLSHSALLMSPKALAQ